MADVLGVVVQEGGVEYFVTEVPGTHNMGGSIVSFLDLALVVTLFVVVLCLVIVELVHVTL